MKTKIYYEMKTDLMILNNLLKTTTLRTDDERKSSVMEKNIILKRYGFSECDERECIEFLKRQTESISKK